MPRSGPDREKRFRKRPHPWGGHTCSCDCRNRSPVSDRRSSIGSDILSDEAFIFTSSHCLPCLHQFLDGARWRRPLIQSASLVCGTIEILDGVTLMAASFRCKAVISSTLIVCIGPLPRTSVYHIRLVFACDNCPNWGVYSWRYVP